MKHRLLAGVAVSVVVAATFAIVLIPRAHGADNPQVEPTHMTAAEFDALFKKNNNWGRWGKDDAMGTLNLITEAKRKQAASLVKV